MIEWARAAGVLKLTEMRKAGQEAARDGRTAARVFDRAIALREVIDSIFATVVNGGGWRADLIIFVH